MARLLSDLQRAHERDRGNGAFAQTPEYERLEIGAYALGFVPTDYDYDAAESAYQELGREPAKIRRARVSKLRRFVTYMMRAERHAYMGDAIGGGVILRASETGLLGAIAARLHKLAGDDE
jgi:hypothetical protein